MYAQVVNSLILKIRDIVIFAATFANLFMVTGYVSQDSLVYEILEITEIGTAKAGSWRGKTHQIVKQTVSGECYTVDVVVVVVGGGGGGGGGVCEGGGG